jgi:hypothetical protein
MFMFSWIQQIFWYPPSQVMNIYLQGNRIHLQRYVDDPLCESNSVYANHVTGWYLQWSELYLRTWQSLVGEILDQLWSFKVILRPTVCRPVRLGIRHQTGTRDQLFPFSIFFDSFGFVDVGRPLWREVGSVLFSFCRSSPTQPFSDLSPTGLMRIVYCLYFLDSPNQEGEVPVFISPRNRVAQLYPRAFGLRHTLYPSTLSFLSRTLSTPRSLFWRHILTLFSHLCDGVRFLAKATGFLYATAPDRHWVQAASYKMGTWGSFSRAWSWSLTSI